MKIFFSEESINEICTKNFTDKQANDELFKLLEENEMKNTKIIEVKKANTATTIYRTLKNHGFNQLFEHL